MRREASKRDGRTSRARTNERGERSQEREGGGERWGEVEWVRVTTARRRVFGILLRSRSTSHERPREKCGRNALPGSLYPLCQWCYDPPGREFSTESEKKLRQFTSSSAEPPARVVHRVGRAFRAGEASRFVPGGRHRLVLKTWDGQGREEGGGAEGQPSGEQDRELGHHDITVGRRTAGGGGGGDAGDAT